MDPTEFYHGSLQASTLTAYSAFSAITLSLYDCGVFPFGLGGRMLKRLISIAVEY